MNGATVKDISEQQSTRDSCGRFTRSGSMGNRCAVTHGDSYTKLYSVWHHMKNRCYGNDLQHTKYYKGRNIQVCKEWKESYEQFKIWAMGNGYNEYLTIDRIDVNGDYCPQNCRWVTQKEQANNKRETLYMSFNGETHTLIEWAEILGMPYHVVFKRFKSGWSPQRIATTGLIKNKSHANEK